MPPSRCCKLLCSQLILPKKKKSAIADDLNLWHDDLRRVHLLTNDLAVNEFHLGCANDTEALTAFDGRDKREKALWVFHARDKLFRDVELHLAFQAKAMGNTGRSTALNQVWI